MRRRFGGKSGKRSSRCSIYKCERPTDDFGEHRIGGKEPFSMQSKVDGNVGADSVLDLRIG